MMNKLLLLQLALISLFGVACTDTSTDPLDVSAHLSVTMPADVDAGAVTGGSVSFYNVSNGITTTVPAPNPADVSFSVLPGLYNISYSARCTLDGGVEADVRAQALGVTVASASQAVTLTAFAIVPVDDLIISEIYFTGSLQTSGDQYNGDQYFRLYNNTDHTVYADGLTIFESQFLTTQKFNYTPDIMDEAVSVDALYTIPGSGREYPVEPGASLLIADMAINHRDINPNSIDLSHADFEWYDESTDPRNADIDNPAVPNLDKWYCYTYTVWLLHNRGFKAYGVARIPVDRSTYLANYRYTCNYDQVTAAGTFPMSRDCYKLPNTWIRDVVTLSVASEYKWNVSAPALDSGWTHCGTINGDKNRYFHAVRRKMAYIAADGRVVLSKTNNSAHDFNPFVTPSEIENQSEGGVKTIDGITPCD